jgi:hypothetical protein
MIEGDFQSLLYSEGGHFALPRKYLGGDAIKFCEIHQMLSLNSAAILPLAISGERNPNSFGDLSHREVTIFSEFSEASMERHDKDSFLKGWLHKVAIFPGPGEAPGERRRLVLDIFFAIPLPSSCS